MTNAATVYESPLGPLVVTAGTRGITSIRFEALDARPAGSPAHGERAPEAIAQLEAYFARDLRSFALDLDACGTPLQEQVWARLREIPYGATTTYGEIARTIDESLYEPGLEPYLRPRVVGAAVGSNPLAIVVPCHRVIGADGSLTGYRGGLARKRALLELEAAPARRQLTML